MSIATVADPLARVDDLAGQIAKEVRRAVQLHRGIDSLHEGYAVILEELDEFWEQVKVNPKKLSQDDQNMRMYQLRNELIQTAAMCIRTMVDLNL